MFIVLLHKDKQKTQPMCGAPTDKMSELVPRSHNPK